LPQLKHKHWRGFQGNNALKSASVLVFGLLQAIIRSASIRRLCAVTYSNIAPFHYDEALPFDMQSVVIAAASQTAAVIHAVTEVGHVHKNPRARCS
jgi:nitroimidazol reductase NimA-like FMN-containing flavoprotein (pyridoxamine 5'-phosphate oxidase superfamily)